MRRSANFGLYRGTGERVEFIKHGRCLNLCRIIVYTKSKDNVSISYYSRNAGFGYIFGVVLMQWHCEVAQVGKLLDRSTISFAFPCCRVPRSWLAETWIIFYVWNSKTVRHIKAGFKSFIFCIIPFTPCDHVTWTIPLFSINGYFIDVPPEMWLCASE